MKYTEIKKNTTLHTAVHNYVDAKCVELSRMADDGVIQYGDTEGAIRTFNRILKEEYGAEFTNQVRFVRGVKTTVEYIRFEEDAEMVRFVMDWA